MLLDTFLVFSNIFYNRKKSKRGLFMLKNKTISTIFFVIVQSIIMLILLSKGRTDYSWSVLVTTGAWIVYTLIEIKYHIKMTTYVRILMMLTIFVDAFGGYLCNLYENSFIFDKILHVFGTYAIALFLYILIIQVQDGPINKWIIFVLVLCLGLAIGTIYEILEFIGDNVSHPDPPNQPSLLDTDVDLIGDLIGAILAGLHARFKNFIGRYF